VILFLYSDAAYVQNRTDYKSGAKFSVAKWNYNYKPQTELVVPFRNRQKTNIHIFTWQAACKCLQS